MKWSWKLTRLAGIDVYVHATFFMLIAWIGVSFWQTEGSIVAVIQGVGFILALFACIVLHEFGHALTARRYGIHTRYITLLPIGGIAMLERMPDDPKQEMMVALAGPAVNVVIALGLCVWLSISNGFVSIEELGLTSGSFLQRLMAINVMLAVFNMLPALPMDGGRVFRAALAIHRGHAAATETAAKVGQGIALFLGLLGLLYNPFLLFIALFVWIGAAAEAHSANTKSQLIGVRMRQAMLTEYETLLPTEPLSRAVELTLSGSQKDFPIVVDDSFIGVLTQADLLKGLQAQGETARVGDWMQRDIQSADVDEPLDTVLERLQTSTCRLLSVTEAGRLAGIVNLDNFVEFLSIQRALQGSTRPLRTGSAKGLT
jgi:Zn-dependent protease